MTGAALAGASCSSRAAQVPLAPPVEAAPDTAALDTFFATQFPADEPGGAVLVAKQGKVVFARGYGLADLVTREPVTTRTLFNLGSLSKTFVANALLILQERGRLSVDDPLAKYFPDFKHPDLARKIQIRHLLTHTSGLPDNREVAANREFYLTAKDAENWAPVTQADALEFEPGSRFAYSNPAFDALALIVEQVSGKPWQVFVRDEIFLPAGMPTSTITDGPHPATGVAHGYYRAGDRWLELDYGETPTFAAAGNGGVWSSVEELARYEWALEHATFLRPTTVADSRAVKTFAGWTSDVPPQVGWSWFVKAVGELRTVGHTGSQGGFQTNYFVVPDKDVLVVFLTNSPRDFDGITNELQRWLTAANWLDADAVGKQ